MKKYFFILLILIFPFSLSAATYVIPSSRTITWQGHVGVDGGIPTNYTKYGSTINTADQADDTSAIQAALNSASSSQYVELGSGTFTVSSTINVPSGVELRGQGPGSTTIDCNISGSSAMGCIDVYGSVPWYPASSGTPSWDAGYTKGTTQVTLSDTSGLSVGDTLFLDVTNDESTLVFRCLTGCSTFCRDSGTRALAQSVEVTAINGDVVTIDPPLYMDYPSGQSPSSFATTTPERYSGIRDFTVNGANNQHDYNILIGAGNNLWAYNIESDTANRAHIAVRNAAKVTVEKCVIHNSQSYGSVSYGFEMGYNASACLWENNVAHTMVAPFVSYGPLSGSVIAYNYIYDCMYSVQPTWLTPGVGFHGEEADFNLVEGNVLWAVNGDNWWGSSSYNTIFRNRLYGYESPRQYNAWGIQAKQYAYYYNIVGNILGTDSFHTQYEFDSDGTCSPQSGIYETGSSGNCATGVTNDSNVFSTELRHLNYDYVNDSMKYCGDSGEPGCQGGPTDTGLADSLYLSSKPAWFGDLVWPPIDPTGPTANIIPAQEYVETGYWPDETGANTSGSVTADAMSEGDIVNGGKTIVLTLVNDTWDSTLGQDNTLTSDLLAGITSAQSETTGWNNEVRDNLVYSDVVRTSDTVATITLPSESAYSITANETITVTIPADALVTSTSAFVATPSFIVSNETTVTVPKIIKFGVTGAGLTYSATGATLTTATQ